MSDADPPRVDPVEVARRLAVVRARIADAGGVDVAVLAVTKGFGPDAVRAALDNGLVDLGENYAQELVAKATELSAPPSSRIGGETGDRDPFLRQFGERTLEHPGSREPRWHVIGRLQRNKVRLLAPYVSVWQSVDRAELAAEIAKRAPGARVLVQINLSDEHHKGGCSFAEAPGLVHQARQLGLDVTGLMGVAPAGAPETARPGFRRLVALADELDLPERSIGMSGDLEIAVAEGATMVRIGRGLFGARPVGAERLGGTEPPDGTEPAE